MSGEDIASEVEAALRDATAEIGAGVPLTATLTKTPRREYPNAPDPGAPVDYTVSVGLSQYDLRHVDGTQIQAQDRLVMITAKVVTPTPGDKLTIMGTAYRVISVTPQDFGGVALMYEVQCRKQ